ncbi:MAG: S-adenosylmethionine:tRNA ribosyltransferase-isomerase [Bacteroidota bacterium]|nr:S-adenosylmethionine:tRNA ribosyltransferase-isomerase [Bacteroidota bacterium]MDX5431292.1 S-adenosylmethionine:tRNA ribosyltransferase-isomerase [Bacteroidota bacterium]MDX5470030.1 S-adenosylmethionine:tRNA ribosyltransferase-isomerase [Bacteroidota bacterium]
MKSLSLKDFYYDLPEDRIPAFPLEKRDDAKLLVYKKGKIEHDRFYSLAQHLPNKASLVFNTTKVIPARIHFYRETGARIEVLLLEPIDGDMQAIMHANTPSTWEAIIGGLKKWKDGEEIKLELPGCMLKATLIDREKNHVRLSWTSDQSLAEILDAAGKLPLPPYLNRENEESDKERYQTVYAEQEGAVAAPTAGLHFTDAVLESLKNKHQRINLTLHVGAGTFKPVKVDDPRDHDMHHERMVISKAAIQQLMHSEGPIIPVGTTSMRTLESLFWWGCALLEKGDHDFFVGKLQPYSSKAYTRKEALEAIVGYLDRHNLNEIQGGTEILIFPSYPFQLCDGLITNFHLPETTLIMLIAAFVGEDWKTIYQTALEVDYRFLSFGDSSLLIP